MSDVTEEQIGEAVGTIAGDVYLFSGPVNNARVDALHDRMSGRSLVDREKDSVTVFLTTTGGDPHAAYRMARCLGCYGSARVVIAGRCKSAGTLVAIGADELAMGLWGELGPLDAQMERPDELIVRSSGLDILGAWATTQGLGFDAFSSYLIELTAAGLGTKLAAEIAASLASGLFQPVAGQIDPVRLAEAERSVEIAKAYGERLREPNLSKEGLNKLVSGYPTHGFVIDKPEAETVFRKVDDLTDEEAEVATLLQKKYRIIRYPPDPSSSPGFVLDLKQQFPAQGEQEGGANVEHQGAGATSGSPEPRVSEGSAGEQGEPISQATAGADGSQRGGADENTT